MLVHICCSVDSHFFIKKLQQRYPDESLVGFFYDPNIHPYSEYSLRLLDVKRSCDKLGVPLIEGEYDYEGWIEAVRGLESEPEKGKRCDICFDNRLEVSAKKAKEINEKKLTTTLFTSPKKSMEQLKYASKKIEDEFGLEVLTPDFRSGGGTQEQFALAKRDRLYHQNYCGCLFALKMQRSYQKKLTDELMSPIGGEVLPGSIEERLELYKEVMRCEDEGTGFELHRRRFLNYRLLNAIVRFEKEVIPSYFLPYSAPKKEFLKINLQNAKKEITFKDDVVFLSLERFNEWTNSQYGSVKELIFNPLSTKDALILRQRVDIEIYSLSVIIVLDFVGNGKYEVVCKSTTYQDVREVLATFG